MAELYEQEDRPDMRTIKIEVEVDEKRGKRTMVVPSYKDAACLIEDMAFALGATIGMAAKSLEGVSYVTKHVVEIVVKVAGNEYLAEGILQMFKSAKSEETGEKMSETALIVPGTKTPQ